MTKISRSQICPSHTLSTLEPREDFVPDACQPTNVMMLSRDIWYLRACILALEQDCPGFTKAASLVLDVGPICEQAASWYRDDFSAFFTELTQKAITGTFTTLRGFRNVHVHGKASDRVKTLLRDRMCADEFEDPDCVLRTLFQEIDEGSEQYRKGNWAEAYQWWAYAGCKSRRIREGTSWEKVHSLGGEPFLNKLSEIQFTVGIDMTEAGNKA